MQNNGSILYSLLAVLISSILTLQYIPVTFNGKTVVVDISCCKELKDCCSSGVQACSMHRDHGETGSYTSCQASSDMSAYIFMVSKGVFHKATLVPMLFTRIYFTPSDEYLNPQDPTDQLLKPPQASLHG